MLSANFYKQFVKSLPHQPTADQEKAILALSDFCLDIEQKEIFVLKGYAGTGKTTLIKGLIQASRHFKIKTILLAPTGRAAKVIQKITHQPAHTIHKKIYRQKSSKDAFGSFSLSDNLHTNTLFIIDEASMISNGSNDKSIFGSGRLLDDVIKYIYNGERCKAVFIGDTAQLPPVKLKISPALDLAFLKQYLYPVVSQTLNQVHRQSSKSGILHNATLLRVQIKNNDLNIQVETSEDLQSIGGSELIEALSDCYGQEGMEESIVICRSNKRANLFNKGIRTSVLYLEDKICVGDLIMIVKNSYFWTEDEMEIDFIANGDIAEITHIFGYETMYEKHFADVSIRLIDYEDIELNVKILLDTLETETPALSYEENYALFYKILEDYTDLKGRKEQYKAVREDPYFNAIQVKYAYAITCHKAQGGQWKNVFLDQGYVNDDMVNKEYLRWLYTAFTRPSQQLFLINFSKKMLKLSV